MMMMMMMMARDTLKATTRKFFRSALMPLSRRYRTDRMFNTPRMRCQAGTDTMDARCKSIHGNRYAQVFGTKDFFVDVFPIEKKSDCYLALELFFKKWGVPDELRADNSKEQGGRKTEFQRIVRQYNCTFTTTEKHTPKQNPAEPCIRELRRRWYRTMFRTNCPRALWDYGYVHVARIMRVTASHANDLNGRTPHEKVTGETPDISHLLDFSFYDWCWYVPAQGLQEPILGRCLGPSDSKGDALSYWVLPESGIPTTCSTVQRVPNLERQTDATKEKQAKYTAAIEERFKSSIIHRTGEKPDFTKYEEQDWDEDFFDEFKRVYSNPEVKEADDVESDNEDANEPAIAESYLNMEVAIDRGGEQPELARVTKRLRGVDGKPIGRASNNPLTDTRMYEVEYSDGYKAAMSANVIAESMFAQVDEERYSHKLLDKIVDVRYDGSHVTMDDAWFTTSSGTKRRRKTTKGVEVLHLWKDGSSTWNALKDSKDSYPVDLAEFAVENGHAHMPCFAWWINYVLKKRERIIKKIKSKFHCRTKKYGIEVTKTVEQALRLDKENGNTLWSDAIKAEMSKICPAVESFDGDDIQELLDDNYQKISCHFIFDVKLGENFRRKARFVAGGHTTEAPASITYSSVVSRDSVRTALLIAALNDLDVLACDIENAFLSAPVKEKIFFKAGKEFGDQQGEYMIVRKALYGLKSSSASFRTMLANTIRDLGYVPSLADGDVWLKPAVKPNGDEYYEMILCYSDDVLAISLDPMAAIDGIRSVFTLKNDKAAPPEMYLGASLKQGTNPSNDKCWAMSPEKYLKAAIETLETKLKSQGRPLPGKCGTPFAYKYHPAMDVTDELDADGIQEYQELIGVLRWATEIGRVDILLEVALLSTHLALPREGHLEAVYRIFGYLKCAGNRSLYFDPADPNIPETEFQEFEWEDFYRDSVEPMHPDTPKPRGKCVSTHCFVDSNHAGDTVTRRSQTGVLIFVNSAPILFYSKRQNSCETSTFGAELCAMKVAVEMVTALRFKLRQFGVPIEGPTNMFCDNESVWNNVSKPESTLNKKHHSVSYHFCRQAVAAGIIRVAKESSETNLADIFTKVMARPQRERILDRFTY